MNPFVKYNIRSYTKIQKVNRKFLFNSIILIQISLILPIIVISNLDEIKNFINYLEELDFYYKSLISLYVTGISLILIGIFIMLTEYKKTKA